MEIEQRPPNKPNFLLILLLFGAVILVIFVVALLVLHTRDARRAMPRAALTPSVTQRLTA